jgi:ABC-2 type transport system ATP-binding protein
VTGSPSTGPAISARNLVKRFGSAPSAIVAVDGISFEVAAGETCALLGGNGAGKTTTLSMLLGLLTPSAGEAHVLGFSMASERERALPLMNFTSPYVDLPKRLTVKENLLTFARLYSVPRPRETVEALAEAHGIAAMLARPYGALSAGQRTRVSVAKALINRPSVLLLDEPTASLDPDAGDLVRAMLMNYQRESGAAFLLASHNMMEVERMAGRVMMMRGGTIVDQGSPEELLTRYGRANLEDVFLDIARERSSKVVS